MEIIITALATGSDVSEFSASRAERGANAGPETWANANAEAAERPLLATDADVDKARDWFGEFGAWEDSERAAWSATEVNALLVQFVSGDLREAQSLAPGDGVGGIDWSAYEAYSSEGTLSGSLFCSGDDVYFTMG